MVQISYNKRALIMISEGFSKNEEALKTKPTERPLKFAD